MKKYLKKLATALSLIGINLRMMKESWGGLPRYLSNLRYFSRLQNFSKWKLNIYPIFGDRNSSSAMLGEYFWQDLFVATKIIEENPRRHIDVGSRIDGFVAHLACVRKVEVFDIRPLEYQISNVKFVQWDLTGLSTDRVGISDCVSCLHTLEHIGLGRYGDNLDPDGWVKGIVSLTSLVALGGKLWISVPVGRQRVEFDAHRVFHPSTIIDAVNKHGMKLSKLFYFKDCKIIESVDIEKDINHLSQEDYTLGIFLFTKIKDDQFNDGSN